MPVESAPYSIFSPVTYFIDLINYGLSGHTAFGSYGFLLDFGILILFCIFSIAVAFKLHELVLQKRFTG